MEHGLTWEAITHAHIHQENGAALHRLQDVHLDNRPSNMCVGCESKLKLAQSCSNTCSCPATTEEHPKDMYVRRYHLLHSSHHATVYGSLCPRVFFFSSVNAHCGSYQGVPSTATEYTPAASTLNETCGAAALQLAARRAIPKPRANAISIMAF